MLIRLIFFALLLANVAFYAWRQNAGPADGHEPERLEQQLAPEKLKLILPERPAAATKTPTPTPPPPSQPAEAQPTAAPAATTPAATSPASKPETPADSAKPAADAHAKAAPASAAAAAKPDATPEAPALLCKSFGGFTADSAKAAQQAINNSSPNTKVVLIPVKDGGSYWVHIPSQKSKAGAEKKVAELKELGVSDSFIVSDSGPTQWSVSLGLFRSKEMAENYLQKLSKQGVRSARIETRDNSDKVRIEVSAPADALGVLARELKPLANASLGECKPAEVAKN